ncbi:unnamed protein product [Lactuca virosa]|uniref:Bulb-type lectin domain-containing protein n=1 Tax=Lactuca virosa TaxID=75947 RepID=A0AAU9NLD3_9ASTR|nr:unnamed protein product [Lactuca virosa]
MDLVEHINLNLDPADDPRRRHRTKSLKSHLNHNYRVHACGQLGSFAVDSIASNQDIQDGETIVSTGGMYELGFFSPSNSNNRYLGIWFKKISTGRVVWIANREFPIPNKTGTLKINRKGHLLLSCCGDTLIWSSNSSAFVRYNNNPVAQLLDTGNFVVKDGSSSSSSNKTNFIWQSFDYPGDTLLAGMKLGKDFVTGINRSLTSWKSPDDPSTDNIFEVGWKHSIVALEQSKSKLGCVYKWSNRQLCSLWNLWSLWKL